MKCQEGWTGQVLLCGVTCTAHYRAWPEAFKPENCLHRAYVTIGGIYKAHGTRAQPSFHAATLWSNKCDHIAFRRDTLSSKQRSVFVIALLLEQNISSVELLGQFQRLPMCNVSRQQKKKQWQLTANPITGSIENMNRLSVSGIHCFLHSNCHNIFLFPLAIGHASKCH